jgi:integrase
MLKDIKPVKVNFNLRSQTPDDKETAIHCVIRFNRQRIVLSNIDIIEPRFWNTKAQRARNTSKFLEATSLNTSLDSKERQIKEQFRLFTDKNRCYPSVDTFRDICKKALNSEAGNDLSHKRYNLISFTELFIEESEKGRRLTSKGTPVATNTIKIYRTFKRNLIDFKSKTRANLDFDNIGLEFFEEFKQYMSEEKKYSTNTVAKHVRTIKTIITEAKERELCTVEFKGKRYQAKTEATESIYLSEEELNTLYNHDFSQSPRLERVRDLFIVGCWTGLRFSDFSSLTKKHIKDGFIHITTQKTGKQVVIPLHRYVIQTLKKYQDLSENSLPPALSNQKMNQYLKEVAKEAGIKEMIQLSVTKAGKRIIKNIPKYDLVSTHTARRSFATNMYKMNVPTIAIMAITGHKTENSFMKYIKVTPTELAEQVKAIWDKQPKLKVV